MNTVQIAAAWPWPFVPGCRCHQCVASALLPASSCHQNSAAACCYLGHQLGGWVVRSWGIWSLRVYILMRGGTGSLLPDSADMSPWCGDWLLTSRPSPIGDKWRGSCSSRCREISSFYSYLPGVSTALRWDLPLSARRASQQWKHCSPGTCVVQLKESGPPEHVAAFSCVTALVH